MSNVSMNSSKREDREKAYSDILNEIESIKTLNRSLQAYLDHLRVFKKNVQATNANCEELYNINKQWMETLKLMKQ